MEESTVDKMFAERFFESEEYNKMYSNVSDYDNEDHTSWEEAKKAINRDLTGKPKHDIFQSEVDMSGKKVCSTNPKKSTTPQNNQPGSPYHEGKNPDEELKKLEEEQAADKALLMSKLKENIQPSDLFIVVPTGGNEDLFSDFEDLRVLIDDDTVGYTLRADYLKDILGEANGEDIKVYECPDDVAEDEDPMPRVSSTDLQEIYDVYAFFDMD